MRSRITTALPCMLVVASCVPYGDPEEPAPPTPTPDQYAAPGGEEAPAAARPLGAQERPWWLALEDPALTTLEERALAGNFNIRSAWARITQAEALAKQAAAPRWFQVIPEGQASWNRTNAGTFGPSTTYNASASVPVTYEVDWFAKYEGQAQAAHYDAQAARAEVGTAAMTLSANVAEAWYDLVEARALKRLLADQIELNETFQELTVLRFRQGLTSALDTHQQRQQVAASRARLQAFEAQEDVAENRVAVLVGAMPGEERVAPVVDELPSVEPLPTAGVPADLLVNRPDLRAAMRRVQAADERVAASIADHLPSLVLSASAGYAWQKQEVTPDRGTGGMDEGEFSQILNRTRHGAEYSAGANLTIPLFDGFQRKARIDQRRGELAESIADYGDALQQAMLEVENAVAQERQQVDRIEHLEEQLDASSDALESARDRYRQGLSDFLNVLTALQAQQQAEQELLAARRQLLSFRIQLHRALGGTWTTELDPPPAPEMP
ncbi:MAG: TolC family protein [Myxococcota bacterium]